MKTSTLEVALLVMAGVSLCADEVQVKEMESIEIRTQPTPADKGLVVELCHEEKTLGGPELLRIRDSELTLGRAVIQGTRGGRHGEKDAGWSYYVIDQPFTLNRLGGDRYYESVVFQVTMLNPSATAEDLFPKDITSERTIQRKLSLTPLLKTAFKPVEVSLTAGIEKSESTVTLDSRIQASGIGEREFYWEYQSARNEPLNNGTKIALALLRVPKNTNKLDALVHWQAVIVEKGILGIRKRNVRTERQHVTWQLPGAR